MWKKLILTFMLTSAFCMGLSITASAEEVEVIPDVSVSVDYKYNGNTTTLPYSVRNQNTNTYWVNSYTFRPTDYIAYNSNSYNSSWSDAANHAVSLRHTSWANQASDGFLTFDNLVFTLDMTDELDGYYRFESDVYLGLGFNYGGSVDYDFSPAFTVSSAPVNVPDSENGMHLTAIIVGAEEASITNRYYTSKKITTDLVHIYIYSTFYYDSSYGTSIDFDASPIFDSLGVMTYDFSIVRSGGNVVFENFANNRFSYKLFSHVDPPVTPTPIPTPYPGQDTQESINQGVDQIESQVAQIGQILDVQATPVPYPEEVTIDETMLEELETMTLPDISSTQPTISDMWSIFTPIVWFLAILMSAIFVTSVFCYILRGGWI